MKLRGRHLRKKQHMALGTSRQKRNNVDSTEDTRIRQEYVMHGNDVRTRRGRQRQGLSSGSQRKHVPVSTNGLVLLSALGGLLPLLILPAFLGRFSVDFVCEWSREFWHASLAAGDGEWEREAETRAAPNTILPKLSMVSSTAATMADSSSDWKGSIAAGESEHA